MSASTIGLVIVLFYAFGLTVAFLLVLLTSRHNKRRVIAAEQWLRGNLLLIRAECAHVSPDAICVVSVLERALKTHAAVDAAGLSGHLYRLRQCRDSELLAKAGKRVAFVKGGTIAPQNYRVGEPSSTSFLPEGRHQKGFPL